MLVSVSTAEGRNARMMSKDHTTVMFRRDSQQYAISISPENGVTRHNDARKARVNSKNVIGSTRMPVMVNEFEIGVKIGAKTKKTVRRGYFEKNGPKRFQTMMLVAVGHSFYRRTRQ